MLIYTAAMESPEKFDEAARLAELKGIMTAKVSLEGMDKISNFYTQLKKEYGEDEMLKYRVAQVLIGSSTTEELSPYFDLPDGRIEKFIREEL